MSPPSESQRRQKDAAIRRQPSGRICLLMHFIALFLCALTVSAAEIPEAQGGGAPDKVLESLRRLQQDSPFDPQLKSALADAYLVTGIERLKEGRLDEALEVLRSGEELTPGDGRFAFYRGVVLLRQERYGEAESSLLEALKNEAPPAAVYRLLARACYAQGRLYETESYLVQALELDPTSEESRSFLERVRRELEIAAGMETRRSGSFAISYVDGGEVLGEATLDVLQRAFSDLGPLFNSYPARSVEVILYGRRDFSEVTGAPDWAGGAYDGKIRVPVGGLTVMTGELRQVLYHEYAHLLIAALTRGNIPLWLNEGLAKVAEEEIPGELRGRSKPTLEGQPLPFAKIASSFDGLSANEVETAYAQSRDYVAFLLERYGWPRMLDLLAALGEGEAFEPAAARTLLYAGETLRQVEEEWRRQRP